MKSEPTSFGLAEIQTQKNQLNAGLDVGCGSPVLYEEEPTTFGLAEIQIQKNQLNAGLDVGCGSRIFGL